MSDRSDERREGYVPIGRRGWRKTDGTTRMEIQPVTPGWARAQPEVRLFVPSRCGGHRGGGGGG